MLATSGQRCNGFGKGSSFWNKLCWFIDCSQNDTLATCELEIFKSSQATVFRDCVWVPLMKSRYNLALAKTL